MSNPESDSNAVQAPCCRHHFGQFFCVNLAQVREVSHRAIRLALCHDSWKCVPVNLERAAQHNALDPDPAGCLEHEPRTDEIGQLGVTRRRGIRMRRRLCCQMYDRLDRSDSERLPQACPAVDAPAVPDTPF